MLIKKSLFILSLCFTPAIFCNQALLNAAKNNDLAEVKRILEEDPTPHINFQDEHGNTPLIEACRHNNFDMAKLLINNKAAIHMPNKDGFTPLLLAYAHKNSQLEKYIDDNDRTGEIRRFVSLDTALRHACKIKKLEIIKLCLSKGADINYQTRWMTSPLRTACRHHNFEIVQFLIDNGANVNLINKTGDTALMTACNHDAFDIAQFLIDNGADVNLADDDGNTPLMIACNKGAFDRAQFLIDNGADVNLINKAGDTALMLAFKNWHPDIAKLLIKKDAQVDIQNKLYQSVLTIAWENQQPATIQVPLLLLAHPNNEYLLNNHGANFYVYIRPTYPIIQFAKILRIWINANKASWELIPKHATIEQAFPVDVDFEKTGETFIATFLHNREDIVFNFELTLMLRQDRRNFAITHFEKIYANFLALTNSQQQ